MNPWDNGKIEMLRRLVAQGYSANQIAKELGGFSRNAIVGKCTRLGLTLSGQVGRPDLKPKSGLVRTSRVPKKKPEPAKVSELQRFIDRAPPPVADSIPMPKSLGLTLMELESHNCRWSEGEREHITFCGHQIEQGRSYCAYHVRLSRGKGTESERRAARELMRAA